MDLSFLLRGIALGFSIAAPVGPIGVLCIRRTLAEGRIAGLVSGLGAATADTVYGGLAAFGLTLIAGLLAGWQGWLRLLGGLFLCYLGLSIFRAAPPERPPAPNGGRLVRAYLSTCLLTLTNPLTIFSFALTFAGLGLANTNGDYLAATLLVLGVFIGSALWWLLLSTSVSLLRGAITIKHLRWINRGAGGVIVGFGVLTLISLW